MAYTLDTVNKIITITSNTAFADIMQETTIFQVRSIRGLNTVDLVDYRMIIDAGVSFAMCKAGNVERLVVREPENSNYPKIFVNGTLDVGDEYSDSYSYTRNNGHVAIYEDNLATESQSVWSGEGYGGSGRVASLFVNNGGTLKVSGNSIHLTGSLGARSGATLRLVDATITGHYIYPYCAYDAIRSRINALAAIKLLGNLGDVRGLEIVTTNNTYYSSSGTTPRNTYFVIRDLPKLPAGYSAWQGGAGIDQEFDFKNITQDCTEIITDSGTYSQYISTEFYISSITSDGVSADFVTLYRGDGDWSESRYTGTSSLIDFRLRQIQSVSNVIQEDIFLGYNGESKIQLNTFAYGYNATTQVVDAKGIGEKTFEPILLPDFSITQRDKNIVAAYTEITDVYNLHDVANLWLFDNYLTYNDSVPTTREGNTIISNYNINIDPTATEVFGFDGTTITIKASNVNGNITSSGVVTLLNSATVTGTIIDSNGTVITISTNTPQFGFYGEINGTPVGAYETGITEKKITIKSGDTLKCVVGYHGYLSQYKEITLDNIDEANFILERQVYVDTSIDATKKQNIADLITTEVEDGGQTIAIVVLGDMQQYTPSEFIAGFDWFIYNYGDMLASAIVAIGTTQLYEILDGTLVNSSPNFYARLTNTITQNIAGGYYIPIMVIDGQVGINTIRPNTSGILLGTALWTKQTANISASDISRIKEGLALETTCVDARDYAKIAGAQRLN